MVESKQKPYDTSLKSLLQEQVADMLPYLLPGSEFEQELNVEVIRPTMLTDRVYRVRYRGQQHILHLEMETGSLVEMPTRLLGPTRPNSHGSSRGSASCYADLVHYQQRRNAK